ncbi:hypothetical protein TruAng_009542 [Truncatella angustata]|nr:hypothetical protein TruAng_009542 [Truncatella angustata]
MPNSQNAFAFERSSKEATSSVYRPQAPRFYRSALTCITNACHLESNGSNICSLFTVNTISENPKSTHFRSPPYTPYPQPLPRIISTAQTPPPLAHVRDGAVRADVFPTPGTARRLSLGATIDVHIHVPVGAIIAAQPLPAVLAVRRGVNGRVDVRRRHGRRGGGEALRVGQLPEAVQGRLLRVVPGRRRGGRGLCMDGARPRRRFVLFCLRPLRGREEHVYRSFCFGGMRVRTVSNAETHSLPPAPLAYSTLAGVNRGGGGFWLSREYLRCTSSCEGRLSRNRFIVRLGRCEGVAMKKRCAGDDDDVFSVSMCEEEQPGRDGELNALPVLLDDNESSDSERLRLSCIAAEVCFGTDRYWTLM